MDNQEIQSACGMEVEGGGYPATKQRVQRLLNEGNIDKAGEFLERLIESRGHDAELWHMLGVIKGQQCLFQDAIECAQHAISIDADYTDAYFIQAQAYMCLRLYAEALSAYSRVLDRYPDHFVVIKNSGYASYKLHNNDQALAYFKRALQLAPGDKEILNNMGLVMAATGRLKEAEDCYRAALSDRTACPEAGNNLGELLRRQGRFADAIEAFKYALKHKPDYVTALVNLGTLMQRCSMHDYAENHFRRAVELDPMNIDARSALVFNLNYHVEDPEVLYKEHVEFGQIVEQSAVEAIAVESGDSQDKVLRVGYVSPDFRTHSIAYFMKPILEYHDPEKVECICYSDVRKSDSTTECLRMLSGQWRDIAGLSTADVVEMIREDRIDILVDLAGHTGDNRLPVFANKPAPVQVAYLGYPNTTGVPAIDYRITDAWADPPGATERYHTEELVRLPRGFICYQAPEGLPAVNVLPALKRGTITFGSFNNLAKITADVVALWARVLLAVPDSRLIVKSRMFEERWACDHFLGQFRKSGIEDGRVQLHGFLPAYDHFSLYGDIDIGLDTFPYNGTTTMCESLWMGVPSITLAGQMHAGRVGASILKRIGLLKWITDSPDEYVEAAIFWSNHMRELSELRMSLRDRMAQSGLCDAGGFAQDLEAVYRAMWNTYIAKNNGSTRIRVNDFTWHCPGS